MISTSTFGSSTPITSAPSCQCWRYRPACGLLGAEVGREVPNFPRNRRAVLHERTHDRCGALGAQREVPAAPIDELVHLLAHDVG